MTTRAPTAVSGGLRTDAERGESSRLERAFESDPAAWATKMDNFPKYVRRQPLTRFLALYELFKLVLPIKGSVVECGVHQGFGLMTWSKLSALLEPVNLMRRVYGFDTFAGFPDVGDKDRASASQHVKVGDLTADVFEQLTELTAINDSTRYLGHVEKTRLIHGDATATIPQFIRDNPHIVVSLLFLDFDLYEPTRVALEHFLPRMPKGAVVAFDELDNPLWPGETLAMLEAHAVRGFRLQRFQFDPYIGYAVLD